MTIFGYMDFKIDCWWNIYELQHTELHRRLSFFNWCFSKWV